MEFSELLLKRESCRKFSDIPVSRGDLVKIIDAGRMAPSACNSQPWKFMVVDSSDAKEKLCDALVLDDGKTGAPWRKEVPAFIVFLEQDAKVVPMVREYYGGTQRFAAGDMGGACLNMCYRATELGLSTCIIGITNERKMKALFGIPDPSRVRFVLAIGYAKEETKPRKKERKDIDEVVCFNLYK